MTYQEAQTAYSTVKRIDGWFSEEAALLLALLNTVQQQHHIVGDIFEIGVHHGKSTLYLHRFLAETEEIRVCDLFGDQSINTSVSGLGDKQVFLDNSARIIGKKPLPIFEKPSSALSISEIGTTYRIFHVDGGHSYQEALADLELANLALREDGIIVLDDPFRSEWPGVTEAAIEFLKNNPEFSALVVGFNKLILVRNTFHGLYSKALDDISRRSTYKLDFPWAYKSMIFLDNDLRCFYMPTYLQNPSLKVRTYIWLKKLGFK